jgi:hypothetical protein
MSSCRILFFNLLFFIVLISSCTIKSEKNVDTTDCLKIKEQYIKYLNDYSSNNLGSVEIKRMAEKTYWVTYVHDAGTRQEIYWLLDENHLLPTYEFEYGGMNWKSELNYTFRNIKNSETITGNVYGVNSENQISILKEKFINKQ